MASQEINDAGEIGRHLRLIRRSLKLKQEDVALAANCSLKFLVDLEAGKQTSPVKKVFDVIKVLGGKMTLTFPELDTD